MGNVAILRKFLCTLNVPPKVMRQNEKWQTPWSTTDLVSSFVLWSFDIINKYMKWTYSKCDDALTHYHRLMHSTSPRAHKISTLIPRVTALVRFYGKVTTYLVTHANFLSRDIHSISVCVRARASERVLQITYEYTLVKVYDIIEP